MSGLIKNIFLPEKIGNSYLFSKRIVGVDINETSITVTKTRVQKENATIEMVLEEMLDHQAETDVERVSRTLKNLFSKIGNYDEIRTALPSSVVIFKELTLPFITRDQITMVIGFEIEPLLPFPLQDSVIDFVIVDQNISEKSSHVMVAASQKYQVLEHLALFQAADIDPEIITVDMLALYSLYKRIPSYTQLPGGTALIDISLTATHMALMLDGKLKMVRTLSKGILFIAKKISLSTSTTPQEAMENLLRFGLEKSEADYSNAANAAVTLLWNDIHFTLVSFSNIMLNRQPMTKIIFLGHATQIHKFIQELIQKGNIESEIFNVHALEQDKTVSFKNTITIAPTQLISVGCSLPSLLLDDFNMRQKELSPSDQATLLKQLVVCAILIVAVFTTVSVHYTLQIRKLKKEVQTSTSQALTALQEKFPSLKEEKKLSDAIDAAKEEVRKQQATWFAFSNQARGSFLQYLYELTSHINANKLGFTVDQITIADGVLTLKAQVRGIDELKMLERTLSESTLFKVIEPQEKPQFTMRIILAHNGEEFS